MVKVPENYEPEIEKPSSMNADLINVKKDIEEKAMHISFVEDKIDKHMKKKSNAMLVYPIIILILTLMSYFSLYMANIPVNSHIRGLVIIVVLFGAIGAWIYNRFQNMEPYQPDPY